MSLIKLYKVTYKQRLPWPSRWIVEGGVTETLHIHVAAVSVTDAYHFVMLGKSTVKNPIQITNVEETHESVGLTEAAWRVYDR